MDRNKMLKVLLVAPYSSTKVGGIVSWTKNILDYVGKQKTLELMFQNTEIWFKSNLQSGFISRILLGSIDSLFILSKLVYNIALHRPDAVHYTSSASLALYKDIAAAFIVRNLFKRKFIIHWHFGRIPLLSQIKNSEYKRLIAVAKLASVNIVIDENSYESLRDAGISNVSYIPNPISNELKVLSSSLNVIDTPRDIGQVVYAGHITESKGVIELVSVCADMPLVSKLVLIGPYLSKIKRELINISLLRDNGKWLEFKGEIPREAVMKYLQRANVLCLPSHTEGFPNIIIEAMANACPIIATKVGAIPEMLSNESGICIDVKDEPQLKEKIEQLITNINYARMLGENARQKVLNNYTLDIIFNEYLKLWFS